MSNNEKVYTIRDPRTKDVMYVNTSVDVWNNDHLASLMTLRTRYGVTITEATEEELKDIDDMEAEQEAHEPDIIREWPEDDGAIVLTIKEW